MSDYKSRVREFAETIHEERGTMSLQALAAEVGMNSQQALSNKLNGATRFQPDEVARLAQVLHLHPVPLLEMLWPDIAVARAASEGKPTKVRKVRTPTT